MDEGLEARTAPKTQSKAGHTAALLGTLDSPKTTGQREGLEPGRPQKGRTLESCGGEGGDCASFQTLGHGRKPTHASNSLERPALTRTP